MFDSRKGKWKSLLPFTFFLWTGVVCQAPIFTKGSRSYSNSTNYSCLQEHLKEDAQLLCQEEILTSLNSQFPNLLQFTASRGNPFKNLRLSLRELNLLMRQNYAKMIERTGKNVFPLMIATENEPGLVGVGGVWKVYFADGSMKRIAPVSPDYEMDKSIAHVVLAVFAIISPYFLNPRSTNWQPELRALQEQINEIRFLLEVGDSSLPEKHCELALQILERSSSYIDKVLHKNAVYPQEFQEFASGMAPLIEVSIDRASALQVEATITSLLQLKEEMGEEQWRKLYVIIPTIWPVSLYNVRLQVLEKLMSFEQIKNQVLLIDGLSDEDLAKTMLGRIISDRTLAQLIWGGTYNEAMQDHLYSLSTRRDLLSTKVADDLGRKCEELEGDEGKPKCPFAGRAGKEAKEKNRQFLMTMLRP